MAITTSHAIIRDGTDVIYDVVWEHEACAFKIKVRVRGRASGIYDANLPPVELQRETDEP